MPISWEVEGGLARLQMPGFAAMVSADHPANGLTDITVSDVPWPCARLLGVAAPSLPGGTTVLVDWHARGADLVAAYEPTRQRPIRVDIVWRVLSASAGGVLPSIDLIVSVRTELLDARPDVRVESLLTHGEVRGTEIPWFDSSELPWDYVEMVHPADLRRSELLVETDPVAGTRVRHHLFVPESLEKGVILRSRTRGAIMPRDADPLMIDRCYAVFSAAEPPLSGA